MAKHKKQYGNGVTDSRRFVPFNRHSACSGLAYFERRYCARHSRLRRMLYGGAGFGALGFLIAVASIVSSGKQRQRKKSESRQAEHMGDVELSLDGTATYNGQTVEYIPNQETYEFVNMGKRQSIDDKFEQIGKMGKTQFVIYVAKLFSLKGYEVQLTPVADNHDIDMIIKKEGQTRAVGCLLAGKVLSAQDVKIVNEGKDFYQAAAAMSVTNMFSIALR